MRRPLVLVLFLAIAADARLFSQRQGGPAPPGRQGGAGPGGAGPAGRQGGPPRPARDRTPAEGTGAISGRVLAADTGTPVRRAEVQALYGGEPPRTVSTDGDGRFELRGLPRGTLTLRASKPGFVSQQSGQRSAFSGGEPVALAEGQQLTIDFRLVRGGAIIGRVFDDLGEPIANARVTALRPTFTPAGRRLTNAGSSLGLTDDTGAYRVYGLAAGSYYVSAVPQNSRRIGGGELTDAPTFFPGTNEAGAAQRVSIAAGQEQHNIDFALTATRSVRISGTVVNSSGQPIQASVNLTNGISDDVIGTERRAGSSSSGSFTVANVPPGNYVLEVTGRSRAPDVPPEVAAVPISVGDSDVTGLSITTGRGASVVGSVASEDGSRIDPTSIRVSAPPVRGTPGAFTPRAQVTGAARFELAGLVGAHTLRFEQLPSGWIVKSVTANGADITDVPLEFRSTEEVSVRVVLTDRITQLTGTVRSDTSPRGAAIVVFPGDKSRWSATSRYVRTLRADEKGQFMLRGLPGNERYLAVALDYLETGEQLDPDFLSRLRPLATSVTLGEGEQKQIDLTLQPRP